jgi:hypothetical protein
MSSLLQVWRAPPHGVVKVNWNARVGKVNKQMSIDIIVRDFEGLVLAIMCSSKPFIMNLGLQHIIL